jgi:hypothetical protein
MVVQSPVQYITDMIKTRYNMLSKGEKDQARDGSVKRDDLIISKTGGRDRAEGTTEPAKDPKMVPRYISPLEIVTNDAISRYVNEVKNRFDLPAELAPFAAYFCKTKRERQQGFFSDHYALRLTLDDTMNGYDYLESLRIILTNDGMTDIAVKELTSKSIASLSTEDSISIDDSLFPEFGLLKAYINKPALSKSTNSLIELMNLPQRGRTFYAGVIDHAVRTRYLSINTSKVPEKDGSGSPLLLISSKDAAEFAKKNTIQDYTRYMKMLKGG